MIRPYAARDLDDLLAVWEAASAVAHPFLSADFVSRERRNIAELYLPQADTAVWVEHDRVVGFLSMLDDEIGGLFVEPARQRCGIGRALVLDARARFESLDVEVFERNEIGRAFYDREGFTFAERVVHAETGEAVLRLRRRRDATDVAREFWRLMSTNEFHRVAAVLAPEFVVEWPMSNERVRGGTNFARYNSEYPAQGLWEFDVHRVVGRGSEAATDVTVSDGRQIARVQSFFFGTSRADRSAGRVLAAAVRSALGSGRSGRTPGRGIVLASGLVVMVVVGPVVARCPVHVVALHGPQRDGRRDPQRKRDAQPNPIVGVKA